jgi:tRNA(Arg) A34 adenosine deaminase TadA
MSSSSAPSKTLSFSEFQDEIEKNRGMDLALIPATEGAPCFYRFADPVGSHEPRSALIDLIQGVYAYFPDQARRILRSRIHYRGAFRPLESGMVKVAAKRVARHESLPELFREIGPRDQGFLEVPHLPTFSGHPSASRVREEIPHSEAALATEVRHRALHLEQSRQGRPLHQLDRPVAALLANSVGEILCETQNLNHSNKTFHAELLLAQKWWAENRVPFPDGARVVVSLKPCKMCAGALWQMAGTPEQLSVIYLEDDLGTFARDTILDSGSLERLRFCDEVVHRLVIQRRFSLGQ